MTSLEKSRTKWFVHNVTTERCCLFGNVATHHHEYFDQRASLKDL